MAAASSAAYSAAYYAAHREEKRAYYVAHREERKAYDAAYHAALGPTYGSWASMRQRCMDPSAMSYSYYGGRGITVCERWNSYANFLADMKERPVGTSIDRLDNDLGYFKENCRWATPKEQAANRRPRLERKTS